MPHVPEQRSACRCDGVQVEPPVVVVVPEGRREGAICDRDAGARRRLDEASSPGVPAEQVARDVQILGLVVVVVARREGHAALEPRRQTVGERLDGLEPAARGHVAESDRRGERPRVLRGNGHAGIKREDRVSQEWAARACPAQPLQTHLIGGGHLHGAMELFCRRRRVDRMTGSGRPERFLEEARRLGRHLGEPALQRLELAGRVVRGPAREQMINELEPRDDVHRRARHDPTQERFPVLAGESGEGVERSDVRGVAPLHSLDFPARVAAPPGQLVHLGQHQADIAVGGVELRRPAYPSLGVAVPPFPQVDEPQIGVPEGLIGSERDNLPELGFGLRELIPLEVGEAPRPCRHRRVGARGRDSRRFAATRGQQQQQPDDRQTTCVHGITLRVSVVPRRAHPRSPLRRRGRSPLAARTDEPASRRATSSGIVHAVTPSWRRGVVTAAFVAAIALVLVLNARAGGDGDADAEPAFQLTNVASQVGITFVHHSPTLDPNLDNIAPLVGSLGAGISVADVNGDGWPDLYLTNSRFGYPNALYVNRGDGTFTDVARAAGVGDVNRPGEGVSMGAVWGDYDNDGLEDLLIYKWGYLQLFKNLGDLRFKDVTESAGMRTWMNANGAVWFDYDHTAPFAFIQVRIPAL